jgi:hypothetical protein
VSATGTRVDPLSLAGVLRRWAAAGPGVPVDREVLAEVRDELEGAARNAVGRAGNLPAGPIRLSKGRVAALLACERHLVLTAGDPGDISRGNDDDEALHLGMLVDVLAEHHVVRARPDPPADPLAVALVLCRAQGSDPHDATVAWVESLDDLARARVGEVLTEKRAALLDGWPAFDPAWWARTQERAAVALADGDLVLDGRVDVVVGGRPTPWPALAIEVKSGRFGLVHRDDGLVYALLLALRDGASPAAIVTATAAGTVHVEPITADCLRSGARRVVAAIAVAGALAAGDRPGERAGWRCRRCPVRPTCTTAAAHEAERAR